MQSRTQTHHRTSPPLRGLNERHGRARGWSDLTNGGVPSRSNAHDVSCRMDDGGDNFPSPLLYLNQLTSLFRLQSWRLAVIYSALMSGDEQLAPDFTHAFGIGGSWQPEQSG